MKRSAVVLFVVIALFALLIIPTSSAQAAVGALCTSDPESGPIGTVFGIECVGFTPGAHVYAYSVQPDGSAEAAGSLKTNEAGAVAFTFTSQWSGGAAALGTWKLVVEELGLAGSVMYRGVAEFNITGGTEGVSGAVVWADKDTITKDEWVNIYGSGFEPFEMVSLWWEYPNGDCSTFTYHDFIFNTPGYRGYSSIALETIKADADGGFTYVLGFNVTACEGKYRIVARGNSSDAGGETWVGLTGNAVQETAWLESSADTVTALFDTISFDGWGYGANEHVSCWLRTSQGQVTSVDQWLEPVVKTDASGMFSFGIYTGTLYPGNAYTSEGALGEYAMTCRGDTSGATAIATFTVTGGIVDP